MSAGGSSNVDILFKEHSFEEIESVRDNLANEIDKRTEQLKSIVKEKYRDVVETSDAIQFMKLNLDKVENSIYSLDKSILKFYDNLRESDNTNHICKGNVAPVQSERNFSNDWTTEDDRKGIINSLIQISSEMWDRFDSGDLKKCVKLYNDSLQLLEKQASTKPKSDLDRNHEQMFANLKLTLQRANDVMKNNLRHKIHSSGPNQIGIIDCGGGDDDQDGAKTDQNNLFIYCMHSAIEILVENFRRDISDTSYHAQIRRYQPYSFFNTKTNQVEHQIDDLKPPAAGGSYVQIPKYTSLELSSFLYETCQVINTIAGLNLAKSSILASLKITIMHFLEIYSELLPKLDGNLKGESKRRRAMQLYFDIMYIRVMLNTSKDIELIEELDPQISQLAGKFELMLDSIELYMVSDAMHTNVLQLIQSTIRLYGLLVPYLK